jgi:putative hydrolase of the HAD superfamily
LTWGGVVFKFSGGLNFLSKKYKVPIEKVTETFLKYDNQVCLGLVTPQKYWNLFKQDLNIKDQDEINFLDLWVRFFSPIKQTHFLIKDLSQKYEISILTNIYEGTFEKALGTNIPDIKYKAIIKSCEVGLVKPDPRIFKYTVKKLSTSSSDILFIDDGEQNVKQAVSLGWNVVLFNPTKPKKSVQEIYKKLKVK